MEVTFGSLQPQVDEDQAFRFLSTLHGDTQGYIGLTLISPEGKVKAGFATTPDIREALSSGQFFTDLIRYGRSRWNIYVSVGAFGECPPRGSRGYATQITEIPGVWADFDVKPGQADAFQTVDELEQFLAELPEMTIRVDTGSGGVHGYWLFPEPLRDMTKARKILSAWHALLCAKASGRHVDNVQELSRILRIPGTVRWPKALEQTAPVTLAWTKGPRYEPADLWELARHAYRARQTVRKEQAQAWKAARDARHHEIATDFVTLKTRDEVERAFDDLQDWEILLDRAGWTLSRDNRDGSGSTAARYWAQPGMPGGTSAMTDYGVSKMMVFYTTHPDWDITVIPDLLDGSGRRMTTKYYFALGALYGGDEKALIMDIVNGKGVLP